jgi:(1->4)-alpha-D-glucan 1-alpha-D-glucosylmutase
MRERQKRYPNALLATATHDHKRGEDTRARLAVLSEIPGEWETAITRWTRLNAIIRQDAGPSMADELMLYQMLVAAWPLGLTAQETGGINVFAGRIAIWQEKSMREAKLATEWASPNDAYETAAREFLRATLDPARPVLAEIIAFAVRISGAGAINGLAQTLLRMTTPGVPDLYQGTEFWDQSLVDPDNRRPVDYLSRQAAFRAARPPDELLKDWQTGAVKQAIIARALALRRETPALFAKGDYTKLEAEGCMGDHVLAFTRRYGTQKIAVAVTRLAAPFVTDMPLIPACVWDNTIITIPDGKWTDVLSGVVCNGGNVSIAKIFAQFPVALFRANASKQLP